MCIVHSKLKICHHLVEGKKPKRSSCAARHFEIVIVLKIARAFARRLAMELRWPISDYTSVTFNTFRACLERAFALERLNSLCNWLLNSVCRLINSLKNQLKWLRMIMIWLFVLIHIMFWV